ncbi:MAG: glycosyl transferase group 1 [uncultured bacterium]|nr:MAG: glycosyl transferase group 1 [uncultured bacterium]
MKIAIIHNQYVKQGGMESYLFDLIAGFNACGDSVEIFTYKVDKDLAGKSVHLDKLVSLLPKFIRKFCFIYRINKVKLHPVFDLVISLTRTSNQDIIVCGGTHKGYLKHINKTATPKDKLEIYCEHQSYLKTPFIMAHSVMMKNEIIEMYNIDPSKIHVIHPPINTNKFHYELKARQEKLQKKFNINKNKTTLLFPSLGHERKGLSELLLAMKNFSSDQVELLVVGKPIINNSSNNVRYLGFINNIEELYAAVDFTVLPSHYEPFGLVAIESVQCGTPVIISKYVGAQDLLTNNECVIIEQVVPDSITDAINKAINSKFKISPDFAQTKQVTIQEHINKTKAIYYLSLLKAL